MMRVLRAPLVLSVALVAGCLDDPELRSCGELPFGTEGCGSPCETYCETVVERCPALYSDVRTCNVDCALEPVLGTVLPAGTQGETRGNTLACRISQALAGACADADLVESRACGGATCEDYCTTMLTNCAGAYPSREFCLNACEDFPVTGSDADAHSLECRLKYARQATPMNQVACDAASMGGGNVCGDVCNIYCAYLDVNCAGENAVYPSLPVCLETCALLDDGGFFDDWSFDIEADTVQCRLYHAGPPAEVQPDTHCPHAAVYNEEHCGIVAGASAQPPDWPCTTFCDVVESACPGTYPDPMACALDCASFPEVVDLLPGEAPNIFPVSSTMCPP